MKAMPAARLTEVGTELAAGCLARDHGDVYDTPAPLLSHLGHAHLREPHGRYQLQVQVLLPQLLRRVHEAVGVGGTGVVHQDVDATELVQSGLDEPLAVLFLRDVSDNGKDLAAALLSLSQTQPPSPRPRAWHR